MGRVLSFCLGACLGSFVNVIAYRFPLYQLLALEEAGA